MPVLYTFYFPSVFSLSTMDVVNTVLAPPPFLLKLLGNDLPL